MTRFLAVAVLALVGLAGGVRAADDDRVQQLLAVLSDPDKSSQSKKRAIEGLGALRKKAESAVPEIAKTVANPDLAYPAINSLGLIGKAGVPALIDIVKAQPPHAVPLPKTLSKEQREAAIKALHHDLINKIWAVDALKRLKTEAADATDVLIAASSAGDYDRGDGTTSYDLRLAAMEALGQVASDETAKSAATHLIALVASPDLKTSRHAVVSIQGMGARAKPAVPGLVKALKAYLGKENGAIKTESVLTIVSILKTVGSDAEEALPVLRELLTAPDTKANGSFIEGAIEAIKAKKK